MSVSTAAPSRLRMIVVLGMLSTFGPLSLDLYLPALPQLHRNWKLCLGRPVDDHGVPGVGLATGQLIAGPVSDRLGGRRPLIVG